MENVNNKQLDIDIYALLAKLDSAMTILEKMTNDDYQVLYRTIYEIGQDFDNLRKLYPHITGSVPIQLLEQIDQGITPDKYVKQLLQEVKECTEKVKKKQEWLKKFKSSLDSLIDLNFTPEEILQSQPDDTVVQENHLRALSLAPF